MANDFLFSFLDGGTVTTPAGFMAAGIHAGFRRDPKRLDCALIVADEPCAAAGVFTQNVFCAAPVRVSREHLDGVGYGTARALVVNSGIANAATGPQGLEASRKSARIVAEWVGCPETEVLVASTGVIGVQLDTQPLEDSIGALHVKISASAEAGHDAACAIMTTDTRPKECALQFTVQSGALAGTTAHIGGICKGSGMIMPNMATMIACLTTDFPITAPAAHEALRVAVGLSFNKVTVDSDTSTNDSCFLFASGAADRAAEPIGTADPGFDEFAIALAQVCTYLAREMARDGEGATRLVTVNVAGAASDADADLAARAVANSPLVKTAVYGHDANWGRIAAALGRSGARFSQEQVSIDIMGLPVLRAGLPVEFSEAEALERFEQPEVVVDVSLGAGNAQTTVWTCDFSHEYVSINGDYRS